MKNTLERESGEIKIDNSKNRICILISGKKKKLLENLKEPLDKKQKSLKRKKKNEGRNSRIN